MPSTIRKVDISDEVELTVKHAVTSIPLLIKEDGTRLSGLGPILEFIKDAD